MWLKAAGFFLALGLQPGRRRSSGGRFQAEGRYAEAETAIRSALEKAETSAKPLQVARSLNELGMLLQIRGDFLHAEELYRRAIAIWETSPEQQLNLAAVLNNLANVYGAEAQYDKAEPLCRRALEIQMRISGPESRGVADTLSNLGSLQYVRGHYAEAESTFRKVLVIWGRLLSPEDPRLAETLCSLGRVCIAVGRYSEAERLYQRVLSIRERVLGSEHHPETARIWSQMAKLYLFEKQYGKAAACGQSDSHLGGGTRTRSP